MDKRQMHSAAFHINHPRHFERNCNEDTSEPSDPTGKRVPAFGIRVNIHVKFLEDTNGASDMTANG
ncbi:hypothetical protein T265_03465 [Opisthorchis viverrini]|uniref:Uncharacterized protein n=1 Tax=Opisthorchis viverrini TaxID=6198 RepID=A0A074ZRD4_OPIVI|nr:hypothetical protein T265_03465 [Opisthorchis viverrini]KER29978.1 hypothetical protein T265_03465 [Opisthorchis viverrini]